MQGIGTFWYHGSVIPILSYHSLAWNDNSFYNSKICGTVELLITGIGTVPTFAQSRIEKILPSLIPIYMNSPILQKNGYFRVIEAITNRPK